MTWLRVIFASILFIVLFSSQGFCAQSTKDITASDDLKQKAKVSVLGSGAATKSSEVEYIIGSGDFLEIQVYGEGSMAVSAPYPAPSGVGETGTAGSGVQVRIDGRISVKHIGDVEADGMTLTQLADYLKILYSTVYDDPIVTVVLNKSNSKRYTVMGKVAQPGIFQLEFPINLVQVIARSGGFTEWANSEMTVVRKELSKDSKLFNGNTLRFDYDDFLGGRKLERNILIKSGDIIIVH
ncbi:polysaccharide biosynthesis/export family protein [Desulfosediminicola flagellatus]|uniref:polysaccharide biosynthesis/export family protein n=1 Tax=Desulfosediminicola flagellatus TaxID=2569541 RepID=UPI00159428B7|nr:polysaccharide biosynthesis/export family protein [Desulfosediminicola flagellatus]